MATPYDSFIVTEGGPASDTDEIDSLPSISSGILDDSDLESESDAQEEWEASLEQLQLMLNLVLIPFVGKFFGRKFAYWSRSSSPVVFWSWRTNSGCLFRLGAIHGMDAQRRD